MRIRANHDAKIRILCHNQIVFDTTLDKILKMFPFILENNALGEFAIEVEDS